jgi:hypothetical protein
MGKAFEEENRLTYKLNGVQGDKWIVENHEPTYVMGRIGKIDSVKILGKDYIHMNTYYYTTQDTTDTLGMVIYASNLAKGLGLIWRGGGEYMGSISIKGAVVNGELYGDTTQIITSVFDLEEPSSNSNYKISQNYPNPFNPSTTISYSIPKAEFVTLKVFDILGRETASLVNESKEAGNYSLTFNAGNIPSGIYFYKLTSGSFMATKKLILLK